MYKMKEQDKTTEKKLNEVEIGNIQNNDSDYDPGPRKRMEAKIEKRQETFNKDLDVQR